MNTIGNNYTQRCRHFSAGEEGGFSQHTELIELSLYPSHLNGIGYHSVRLWAVELVQGGVWFADKEGFSIPGGTRVPLNSS